MHDELIEQHLPLVKHVVFQVAARFPRHVDREELALAGALGLVEAARRFDDCRGVPFERFASRRIRGAILDAVRSADWAPRSVRTVARTLDERCRQLATGLGRPPSQCELADSLDTTTGDLTRLQARIHRSVVLALDAAVENGEGDTLGDTLADIDALEPVEVLEARELHAYLRAAVRLLDERHRLIVIGYFLEGMSSAAIGRFLGVTDARVSQLRTEALGLLRQAIEAQYGTTAARIVGPAAKASRGAAFAAAVGAADDWRDRLDDSSEALV